MLVSPEQCCAFERYFLKQVAFLQVVCVHKGIKVSFLPAQFWWSVVSRNLGIHESSKGVYLCEFLEAREYVLLILSLVPS